MFKKLLLAVTVSGVLLISTACNSNQGATNSAAPTGNAPAAAQSQEPSSDKSQQKSTNMSDMPGMSSQEHANMKQ
ncbi:MULTISPECIES: hypothetical protein [Heliobacterium]|uniref:Coproporphyrinogen III oxidase n=1 Tax=Heliobacterium chlorum TaxID=2698 RepID=A0ABR7T209_HELCL|nr:MULTISPECIES: hypothetical protein [Heliobacterium]MBC9784365.1 hypothetical protein [Heliobacterium chlorum]